ncbi:MAG: hypothetical protein ABIJ97_08695 [Bacteroidota bacterium]
MKKFIIIYLLIIVAVVSCKHNIQDVETNELFELTDSLRENARLHEVVTDNKNFKEYVIKILSNYSVIKDSGLTRFYYLDKSEFLKKTSFELKKLSTIDYGDVSNIYPKCELYEYVYENSRVCEKVFSEWIKTIGEDNENRIGINRKYVKSPPVYSIKTDTTITVLYYLCEHAENNWDSIKNILTNIYSDNKIVIMEIDCGGPLKWTETE